MNLSRGTALERSAKLLGWGGGLKPVWRYSNLILGSAEVHLDIKVVRTAWRTSKHQLWKQRTYKSRFITAMKHDEYSTANQLWRAGATEAQQLNPGDRSSGPSQLNSKLYDGAIIKSEARPTGMQLKRSEVVNRDWFNNQSCSLSHRRDVKWCVTTQKKYRHSFCRPENLIFIITNLNILYIILLSTQFWTYVYKIRQFWANYRLRFIDQNPRTNVKMACPLLRKAP